MSVKKGRLGVEVLSIEEAFEKSSFFPQTRGWRAVPYERQEHLPTRNEEARFQPFDLRIDDVQARPAPGTFVDAGIWEVVIVFRDPTKPDVRGMGQTTLPIGADLVLAIPVNARSHAEAIYRGMMFALEHELLEHLYVGEQHWIDPHRETTPLGMEPAG